MWFVLALVGLLCFLPIPWESGDKPYSWDGGWKDFGLVLQYILKGTILEFKPILNECCSEEWWPSYRLYDERLLILVLHKIIFWNILHLLWFLIIISTSEAICCNTKLLQFTIFKTREVVPTSYWHSMLMWTYSYWQFIAVEFLHDNFVLLSSKSESNKITSKWHSIISYFAVVDLAHSSKSNPIVQCILYHIYSNGF